MRSFQTRPAAGRVFSTRRQVRSTDVTPAGRLRFDALARYLQQAAEDDLADAGIEAPYVWLVRKTAVSGRAFPRFGAQVTLHTFCSATGPRWAERTTAVSGGTGGRAAGRRVSARLTPPRPPAAPAGGAWPLRASDFDTAGHVNNAIHWAAVEDVLAGLDWLPDGAELEYHRPVLPGCDPYLAVGHEKNQVSLWLLDGTQRLASARLSRLVDGRGSAKSSANGERDL